MFLYKNLFFDIFYSFNPNHAYWNQWRLFSGNLPGMFFINFSKKREVSIAVFNLTQEVNSVYFLSTHTAPKHT